jgi:hypothetical protein
MIQSVLRSVGRANVLNLLFLYIVLVCSQGEKASAQALQDSLYILGAAGGYPAPGQGCCNSGLEPPFPPNNNSVGSSPGTETEAFAFEGQSASSQATIIGGNPNSLFASASSLGEFVGADALAYFRGSFIVQTPQREEVPILVEASGYARAGPRGDPSYTGAKVSVSVGPASSSCLPGSTDCVFADATVNSLDTQPAVLSVDQTIIVPANDAVGVAFQASADAVSGGTTAYIDPLIEISPAFLASHPGTKLTFSAGYLGTGPGYGGVPEPSTWVMLIISFAGLGYAGWRRGRRLAAA